FLRGTATTLWERDRALELRERDLSIAWSNAVFGRRPGPCSSADARAFHLLSTRYRVASCLSGSLQLRWRGEPLGQHGQPILCLDHVRYDRPVGYESDAWKFVGVRDRKRKRLRNHLG